MAIPPLNIPGRPATQDLVGLELDDERLKIVHVHIGRLKQREVKNIVTHEIRGTSDDELTAKIRLSLQEFQIKNPRLFLSVPLPLVITRSIEIPSRDPEEIKEIVNLQASRHTPYSRSEIIIDTLNLGVVRESYTKVLLVIVPKEAIARQIAIVEKANLRLERVFFPPEAICQACTRILGGDDSVLGIVNMDAGFTNFIVSYKSKILFVRGISIGAQHLLDERETYSDRFSDELQKSMESYTGDEIGPAPRTLILTGAAGQLTEFDDLFQQAFRIPIKHQVYYNSFAISAPAKATAAGSKYVSFFNIIAPLLLFDRVRLDLTSEEKKLKIQLEQRGREFMKTGVLAMVLLSLGFAFAVSQIYFKRSYLNWLQSRYKAARDDAKELEKIYEKTQVVKEYLSKRGTPLEALSELYTAAPDDVRVSEIRYDDNGKFTLKGSSTTMASVFAFVSKLDSSSKFKNVKTKYVTSRKEGSADLADFEINCLIE